MTQPSRIDGLPDLPKPITNMLVGDDWQDVFDTDQMDAHYLKGYEAGSAAAAQAAKQVPADFVLVPRELLRLSERALKFSNDLKDPWRLEALAAIEAAAPSVTSLAEAAEAGQVEAEPKALSHEEIAKAGLGLEYVHSVLRWAACGYVHTPDRIASLHTSYRIVDRIINAPASPQAPAPREKFSERLAALARDPEHRASMAAQRLEDDQAIAHAPSAAPHQGADALREALDGMRVALEVIALGDSKDPQGDALDTLVALGHWRADARAALAQHQAPQQGEGA